MVVPPGALVERDGAAVGAHDRLDEREPEPGAAGPRSRACVAAGEPLEGVVHEVGREARPSSCTSNPSAPDR